MVAPYKVIYTIEEVCEELKVGKALVYSEIKKGKLPAIKLGALKIRGVDLETYINEYPIAKGA